MDSEDPIAISNTPTPPPRPIRQPKRRKIQETDFEIDLNWPTESRQQSGLQNSVFAFQYETPQKSTSSASKVFALKKLQQALNLVQQAAINIPEAKGITGHIQAVIEGKTFESPLTKEILQKVIAVEIAIKALKTGEKTYTELTKTSLHTPFTKP